MPGKVKVRVLGARHLPVMDRSSENTDAFAEVRFGDHPPHKTEVCRKSLNPVWNSEVFKFEVADDLELQEEPVQIRVMDYDTYSANDAIGKVYIDLNPLLRPSIAAGSNIAGSAVHGISGSEDLLVQQHKAGGQTMSGWLPIYDTLHGIRGEVNVTLKVELFSDFNKFRDSSCGVPFYCSSGIPEGFRVKGINGFVEELVVNDDPEYQWIDKIRTPRASNEARQTLFIKLSGTVKRKIGHKALELGGNAVVGYQQKFDVEGDTGIVVRGIGTAVTLVRIDHGHKDLSQKDKFLQKTPTVQSMFAAFSQFCYQSSQKNLLRRSSPILYLEPQYHFSPISSRSKSFSKTSITSISVAAITPVLRHAGHRRVISLTNPVDHAQREAYIEQTENQAEKNHVSFGRKLISPILGSSGRKTLLSTGEGSRIKEECTASDVDIRETMSQPIPTFSMTSFSSDDDDHFGRNYKKEIVQFEFDTPNDSSSKMARSYGVGSLESAPGAIVPTPGETGFSIGQEPISPLTTNVPQTSESQHASRESINELTAHALSIDAKGMTLKNSSETENTQNNESPRALGSSWNENHLAKNWHRFTMEGSELLEYPFITLKRFPQGFLQRIGGLVSARSVKLLDGLEEDDETRDAWWVEIRREIRSHAKCLGCNIVIGYSEDTVICDDVVVLCASGTAAVVDLNFILDLWTGGATFGPPFLSSPFRDQVESKDDAAHHFDQDTNKNSFKRAPSGLDCSNLHVPYADGSLPYGCRTAKCSICGKGRVPDVLFSTIEPPKNFDITGRGCFVQARVLRLKKDLKGDQNAKEISDALPFIEYETHRQLMNKLKVKGMNALFCLKTSISIGDRTVIGSATATACFLTALPSPCPPKLLCSASTGSSSEEPHQKLQRAQKKLDERIVENQQFFGLYEVSNRKRLASGSSDCDIGGEFSAENELYDMEFSSGHKDMSVLEIDDSEDVDILDSLMDPFPPPLIQIFSTEDVIGVTPGLAVSCSQTFSQVWRGRIHPSSRDLSTACQRVLSTIYFKLRRLRPCILTKVTLQADLNEENELQMYVHGTAIALTNNPIAPPTKMENGNGEKNGHGSGPESPLPPTLSTSPPLLMFYSGATPSYSSSGINLSTLSYTPGARIDYYLGNLNFFLIRETSSLREVGGLNSFIHSFLSEVYAIVRSHVAALGGNALVGFFMSELNVDHNPHKNQCQCLLHVGGDVVSVTYVSPPGC